jgi:putative ABC transport system permease protein
MTTTFRHAVHGLRSRPGLAIAAILCTALGTAATTAVATLVSATLLRPVPFPAGDRLVRVWFEEPGVRRRISLSIPDVQEFAGLTSFDAYLGTARVRLAARVGAGAERMRGEAVSAGYFETLGVRPALGRLLAAYDHAPDAPPAVVLSHQAWTRLFGSDPAAVGREFRSANASYTIVGVAARGFDGTVEDDVVEFFVPLRLYEPQRLLTDRGSRPTWVIGRLRPGVALAAAQAEAQAVGRRLALEHPDVYGRWRVQLEPMGENWRENLRGGGLVLFAAAAVLLLIAATNVGSLLLARVLDRRRELAIRASLGADTRRLTLQLLLEALAIVAAGGALGVLAGPGVLRSFLALVPPGRFTLPGYLDLRPDPVALALSAAILAVAGVIAGTAPALLARRVRPNDVLRETGRGTFGSGVEKRWGALLVAGETGLTLVLLVAGALLVRTFQQLATTDVGFDRDRVVRMAVTLNGADYARDPAQLPALYARLQRDLAAVPGVGRVGLVHPTLPPYDGYRSRLRLDGIDLAQAPDGLEVGTHLANEALLPMLGVPIVAGRNVSEADASGDAVAVVSRSLARLMGGEQQALGRTVTFDGDPDLPSGRFRVVGVADDVAWDGLAQEDTRVFVGSGGAASPRTARHDVYVPLARFPMTVVSIGAWTSGDPAALVEPLRRGIASIAPASAVHWTGAMAEEIAAEYAPTRFYLALVAAFSLSALALTSIGVYALLSHAAARRTGEMGLRMALGASRSSIAVLLLRGGLRPLVLGVAGGLAGAALVARGMGTMLYGVERFDTLSFAVAVGVLLSVSLAAGLLPARRAAALDPLEALRTD